MGYIEPWFHRRRCTFNVAKLGFFVALFSASTAVSTVKRCPLKPCSGPAVARIDNVKAQSNMDRGQALLSFDVIVSLPLKDPELHVTSRGEALDYPGPNYKICKLLKHDLKESLSNPCDFDPGVYHAEIKVFGYEAFYLTAEGGKCDLRFEVINNGKVVGCYSSFP